MERKEIIAHVNKLPAYDADRIPEDHEIWEGNEEGAHFKITKNHIPVAPYINFYVLSISGQEAGRRKIISDFKAIFGEPNDSYTLIQVPDVYFYSWNGNVVTEALSKEE